jgi:hypothetical protein
MIIVIDGSYGNAVEPTTDIVEATVSVRLYTRRILVRFRLAHDSYLISVDRYLLPIYMMNVAACCDGFCRLKMSDSAKGS